MYGILNYYEILGDTLVLHFEEKILSVQAYAPGICRIFTGTPHRSDAVIKAAAGLTLTVEETDAGLTACGAGLTVKIDRQGYMDIYNEDGTLICADYHGEKDIPIPMKPEEVSLLEAEGHAPDFSEYKNLPVQAMKVLDPGDHFYGLGDKPGFMDKRGYGYENWNTDDPTAQVDHYRSLYKSIPFFYVLNDHYCYGIFHDNTFRSLFDFGKLSPDYFWFGSVEGELNYYVISGKTPKEVLMSYASLTGTAPLPQRWTLGFHQSKWSYLSAKEVLQVAESMRANDLPIDVIHLDIDYMNGFRVFTWNNETYPDPKALTDQLASMGIKVVTIIDPGVKQDPGYSVYDEGISGGYFAKTPDGDVYANAVWPGMSVFPDFTNPEVRTWWGKNIKKMTDVGVRGIWNDMNEPASFIGPLPDDVQFFRGPHKEVHNLYGHYMSQATYEGLKAADGRRPFAISRACYSGSQKYTIGWTGDNQSIWYHLPMGIEQMCNLSMSGMPIVGTDVGGFAKDVTPELFARWIGVGALSPFFRVHCCKGTRPQEPYAFNEEITAISRKYIKLRYRLMPYLYDLFHEQEKTGLPVFRPLLLEYPNDPVVRTLNDEFMLGSQILAAPVTTQGVDRRMVYLPEGTWYDYWTGEKIEGAAWFIREAPLDTMPLYVKAGTILPVCDLPLRSTDDLPTDSLTLELYPGEGTWTHYEDDGESFAYREGAYRETRYTLTEDGTLEHEVLHDGYEGASKIDIKIR